jgi:predicted DNA-binding transcriptional regulator AlpA
MATRTDAPVLLTTKEAAEFIGLAASQLEKWRSIGRQDGGPMPRVTRLSERCVRYDIEDLKAFLSACKESP